jgi:hypothetical protein
MILSHNDNNLKLQGQDMNNDVDLGNVWDEKYGWYGVIGHGEDVFTRKASEWRKTHRGR